MDSDRFNELVDSIRRKRHPKPALVTQISSLDILDVDVSVLRDELGLTQTDFENILGVSEHLVREWNKGIIKPENPVLLLLHIANKWPEIFLRALNGIGENLRRSYPPA